MMKPRKRFLSLLSLTCFLFCTYSLALSPPYAMRISCGARENVKTPPSNTLWHKDFAYTGGIPGNASLPSFISPKLKTLRYFPLATGSENCYNINRVRKGHYAVRIFFGLVSATESTFDNEPLFDISIQGTQVRSLQSGWTNNDEESFTEALVFLTLGTASLCFQSSGHGDPSILSIEILQVDNRAYYFGPNFGEGVILRTAERLSFGADKAEFDADMKGSPWGGDRFWNLITTFEHGSVQVISALNGSITGASVAPNYYPAFLYQTALASTDTKPELEYTLEVDPNRNYSVWFHFAEIDHSVTAAGQRVFDILINGDIIFHDVDIVSLSGGLHTALVLNTTILVSGRSLTITLHPTVGNYAIINAIEIFQVINAEAQTLAIEVKALQSLKQTLGLPLRLGWNGDPCVPQQHAWSGVDCQFDSISNKWVIDGLDLDNQGLRGYLPNDISKLSHLQTLNLSGNSIHGQIPASLGTIISLEQLDLSYNFFNGSIPENLGQLSRLQILNLNGNSLSGKVPADLGGRLLHRASFNFTDNAGLCGIPGLPTCGPHLSLGAKIGIGIGSIFALLLIITCATCWWKRRQNILRAQRIAARADAPYAKARTHYSRDVQMTRHYAHGHTRVAAENGPSLLA